MTAFSCVKRAADPANEFAACNQWCGNAALCPHGEAPAMAAAFQQACDWLQEWIDKYPSDWDRKRLACLRSTQFASAPTPPERAQEPLSKQYMREQVEKEMAPMYAAFGIPARAALAELVAAHATAIYSTCDCYTDEGWIRMSAAWAAAQEVLKETAK